MYTKNNNNKRLASSPSNKSSNPLKLLRRDDSTTVFKNNLVKAAPIQLNIQSEEIRKSKNMTESGNVFELETPDKSASDTKAYR